MSTDTPEPAQAVPQAVNWRGLCASIRGPPLFEHYQGVIQVLLFMIYLILVIALPVLISAAIGFRTLPRGRDCPSCAQETVPLLSRTIRLADRLLPRLHLQRRWCPPCGWEGLTRAPVPRATPVFVTAVTAARRTRPIRSLELGGRAWMVMLEYWRDQGRCYGRLLFVAPSGKLWTDPLAAFDAATQKEVVDQALALSDRLLTYRLREVISG